MPTTNGEKNMATDYSAETCERSAQHRQWIAAWMKAHREEHRDAMTGEINTTALVEDWDHCCADGAVTLDGLHPAWEIASEIGAADETRQRNAGYERTA